MQCHFVIFNNVTLSGLQFEVTCNKRSHFGHVCKKGYNSAALIQSNKKGAQFYCLNSVKAGFVESKGHYKRVPHIGNSVYRIFYISSIYSRGF